MNIENLKNKWADIDPKRKRYVVVALSVVAFFVVAAAVSPAEEDMSISSARKAEDKVRRILTPGNTRELGMDALSANVKNLNSENKKLKSSIKRLTEELERSNKNSELKADLEALKKKVANLDTNGVRSTANSSDKVIEHETEQPNNSKGNSYSETMPDYQDTNAFFRNQSPENGRSSIGYKQSVNSQKTFEIITVKEDKKESLVEEDKDEGIYIPSGSILTGVLINGMDAPTGKGARKDPFPSTMRIQKEAILPNHYRADVRECFLIVSGFGDLSAERAYLRGETLSCIRDDGGVLEAKLPSYTVGEDGKTGIRGRVVSKEGQMIAKSMMAGFLSGASKAFDVNPIPVINTSPTSGSIDYQSSFSPDSLTSASVKGASEALDRVAEFYVEMAENLYPVIEIDAGRQVDVFVSKGTNLKLVKTGGFFNG